MLQQNFSLYIAHKKISKGLQFQPTIGSRSAATAAEVHVKQNWPFYRSQAKYWQLLLYHIWPQDIVCWSNPEGRTAVRSGKKKRKTWKETGRENERDKKERESVPGFIQSKCFPLWKLHPWTGGKVHYTLNCINIANWLIFLLFWEVFGKKWPWCKPAYITKISLWNASEVIKQWAVPKTARIRK